MIKQRLDIEMVRRGIVTGRSQAESWVKLGKVRVAGKTVTKSGYFIGESERIELQADEQYVSRAGLKLASVVQLLGLDFNGTIVLDVGSSTGGFTDYALKHGAKKVYAVDVGTEQLHPSLRGDARIKLYEKTDIRSVIAAASPTRLPPSRTAAKTASVRREPGSAASLASAELADTQTSSTRQEAFSPGSRVRPDVFEPARDGGLAVELAEVPDIIVIDVSFISLREIVPHIADHLSGKHTQIVAMLKPQFEAGKHQVNKGVIKNDSVRRQILKDFEAWAKQYFVIQDKRDSGVAGAKGNQERFYLLKILE